MTGAGFATADYRVFDLVRSIEGSSADQESGFGEEVSGPERYARAESGERRERYSVREWKETESRGGGLGTSQKGRFGILPRDFTPVRVDVGKKEVRQGKELPT